MVAWACNSALGSLRQEDCSKVEASVGNTVRPFTPAVSVFLILYIENIISASRILKLIFLDINTAGEAPSSHLVFEIQPGHLCLLVDFGPNQ